jgi:hypothetical protein
MSAPPSAARLFIMFLQALNVVVDEARASATPSIALARVPLLPNDEA